MRTITLLTIAVMPLLMGAATAAKAAANDNLEAGKITALINGKPVSLPMLKSDYDVKIDGSMATVTLKQTFFNTWSGAINATYLFPLNQKAAVYAMTMEVGDETIQAVIKRKEEAKDTFEAAKAEGKSAALLDQIRPNMFTQNIANLMPGAPITVTLKYVQQVPKVDGAYELVVPLVVGPRYEGEIPTEVSDMLGLEPHIYDAQYGQETPPATEQIGEWIVAKLPEYPPVFGQNAPGEIDHDRVGFKLQLHAPVPIYAITSSTHDLDIDAKETRATATLSKNRVIGNKDLILRYELGADKNVTAGVLSHFDQRGGFFSVQIEPPKVTADETITPRELVFVLDTSGSMSGSPMRASKTFMRAALKGLRPDDHFRILRFSSNTTQFARDPVPATPDNLRAGVDFVNSLAAGGGTEMNNAINAAFDTRPLENAMRIVVFLTDGYIGSDRQVIQTVAKRIGKARIYAFGVGSSVNRFLLEGLAEQGRGRARYVEIDESSREAAEALAQSLDAPLLTDIEIDWNGLQVEGQSPTRVPDLFAGGVVNVLARYKGGGAHQITVKGRVNGRRASMPLNIVLKKASEKQAATGDSALPLVWARARVFDLERSYTIAGGDDDARKQAITTLGIDFSLQTAFTSFVAVSRKIYNKEPGETADASVALPQVEGVTINAYPSLNLGGSSTPEPEAVFGLLAALFLALARFRKAISSRLRTFVNRRRAAPALVKGLPKRLINDGWWLE